MFRTFLRPSHPARRNLPASRCSRGGNFPSTIRSSRCQAPDPLPKYCFSLKCCFRCCIRSLMKSCCWGARSEFHSRSSDPYMCNDRLSGCSYPLPFGRRPGRSAISSANLHSAIRAPQSGHYPTPPHADTQMQRMTRGRETLFSVNSVFSMVNFFAASAATR
jgi:hypothetical protein